MTIVADYNVRLSPMRKHLIEGALKGCFDEPFDEFSYSRNVLLINFSVSNSGFLVWSAKEKLGSRVGSELSRLNLENFFDVSGEEVLVIATFKLYATRFKRRLE